jgi:hypothetical protein
MPIASPKYPFSSVALGGAPGERGDHGVYCLWDRSVILYIGRSEFGTTIQSQLIDHYARKLVPSEATHYSWELSRNPVLRQTELINEWIAATGQPPRFNTTSPSEENPDGAARVP